MHRGLQKAGGQRISIALAVHSLDSTLQDHCCSNAIAVDTWRSSGARGLCSLAVLQIFRSCRAGMAIVRVYKLFALLVLISLLVVIKIGEE